MKKLFYILSLILFSCSDYSNAQEQLIIDYLETSSGGVKTDLKIKITNLEVSDITVADSFAILEGKYKKEKLNKINFAESRIAGAERSIEKITTKIDTNDASTLNRKADKLSDETLRKILQRELKEKKENLKEVQDWHPKYLNKYTGRDENELLVKKVITTFSYFNPKLNTRQERTETFVISKDGSEVFGIVYKGKLRRKR
jgi:hypothetical protein